MEKSNAQTTLEFAIMSALSHRAHITGITIEKAPIIVDDVIAELFSPHLVWAVKEYLAEKEKNVS